MENQSFIGQLPPEPTVSQRQPLVIDASILDMAEALDAVREDVKLNRIEFIFPDQLNQVDIREEARALTQLDDFDTMYDLTMQMLEKKTLVINIMNLDGSRTELCNFYIVDRFMNLRGIEAINKYPCLITWLAEFMSVYVSKKFPLPTQSQPQAQAAENKSGKIKKRKTKEKAATAI